MKKTAFAALLACALLVSMGGCTLLPKEEKDLAPPLLDTPDITYNQVKAQRGTVEVDVKGSGDLVSVSEQDYYFQYQGGVLGTIAVKLGDAVKTGDLLASLYTDTVDNQIEQQQLTVRQKQLALDDANADLADYQAADPQDTAGKLRSLRSAAQDALFELQKQQLALDQLNKQKQRSTIRATAAGQVVYVASVNAGGNVSAFQTLVSVADPSRLQVRCDGGDLTNIPLGAAVSLDFGDQSVPGTVVTTPANMPVVASSDSGEGTPKAYIQIKPSSLPDGTKLGDSVEVTYVQQKKDNVIVIPSNCLHTTNGKYYVNMLDQNGLRIERDVEIGIQSQTQTEIVQGLAEGESVIQ